MAVGRTDDPYVVRVSGHVAASPAAVFAVIADPQRHPELDGSGSVIEIATSSGPLRRGS